MSAQPDVNTFSDILLGFQRTLHLETLADLGRKPNLVPVQVVACFADIRGFTSLVQKDQVRGHRLAAEFLREFFAIFPKAVLREAWDLEPDNHRKEMTSFQKLVHEGIVPRLAKKLGDGVVLVWELDGGVEKEIDRGVRYAILDIVGYIQEYFNRLVDQTKRVNPQREFNLELGIGLAAGSAWRHDYVLGGQVDYSGTPMNLAARLQDKARPKGVCVDAADYESLYLLERAWCGEGEIKSMRVSGMKDPIKVWFCRKEPLKLRKPRDLRGASLKELKVLLDEPYLERPKQNLIKPCRRPLSSDDLQTLLELREDKEGSFARSAAMRADEKSSRRLQSLIRQMKILANRKAGERFRAVGQRFHEAIAFSSGANPGQCEERSAIVHSLHEYTTKYKNYPKASFDLKQMLKEHQEIAEAIKANLPELAEERMRKHLQQHHDRVKAKVFGSRRRSHEV